ncbi:hypothetical protein [Sphingobium sp.]|uniref:hypothetical protein n=1 Tax=Sphingobium sp. TaxID=1912891 RepID=UPI002CD384C9|nr:hypothetical protein [Sphingobium sp.]HUD90225.1 hypothetical protein [Sphingobium sp.]
MDLNHQYFEHQLSLMRASAAGTRLAKTRHLAAASATAYRISNHQSGTGADAADGWVRSSQNLDLWIDRDLGIGS